MSEPKTTLKAESIYPPVQEEELQPCGHCACVVCKEQATCDCTVKIWDGCTCERHDDQDTSVIDLCP